MSVLEVRWCLFGYWSVKFVVLVLGVCSLVGVGLEVRWCFFGWSWSVLLAGVVLMSALEVRWCSFEWSWSVG